MKAGREHSARPVARMPIDRQHRRKAKATAERLRRKIEVVLILREQSASAMGQSLERSPYGSRNDGVISRPCPHKPRPAAVASQAHNVSPFRPKVPAGQSGYES